MLQSHLRFVVMFNECNLYSSEFFTFTLSFLSCFHMMEWGWNLLWRQTQQVNREMFPLIFYDTKMNCSVKLRGRRNSLFTAFFCFFLVWLYPSIKQFHSDFFMFRGLEGFLITFATPSPLVVVFMQQKIWKSYTRKIWKKSLRYWFYFHSPSTSLHSRYLDSLVFSLRRQIRK